MNCGFNRGYFLLLPCFPIGIGNTRNNLIAKRQQIVFNDILNFLFINLIIIMHQYVAHSDDQIPRYLNIGLTEFLGQMICGFSYDFDVFYKTIVENLILTNVFPIQIRHIFLNSVDGFKYVLQPFLVSNWLSHKSIFCHDWHFQRQKAARCRPQQYQRDDSISFLNRQSLLHVSRG